MLFARPRPCLGLGGEPRDANFPGQVPGAIAHDTAASAARTARTSTLAPPALMLPRMLPEVPLTAVGLFMVGSWVYVYKYRGALRFTGVREYVRKGWPIFAPLNCLLYLFTERRSQRVFMDLADFPELGPVTANWRTICAEAQKLYAAGYFERTTDTRSGAYFDVGFRTFYKYGWSKFYLKWYGHIHASAQALCPETVGLVKHIRSVNGAMFSLLPPGSQLTRHLDPLAVSLRYHLGLSTPNDDACYIEVDGIRHSWRDGQAALFDVTYLHHARNDTPTPRLILMLDVARPMSLPGRIVNFFYRGLASLTVVPNLEGDKRGAANRAFAAIAPLFERTRTLKKTNRPLYKTIKFVFNGLLLTVLALLAFGLWQLIARLVS
jgi:beta-hydroxylase